MAKKHRAYWKGYLRLSLVTIGVEVYNGVESKSEISFRSAPISSRRTMRLRARVLSLSATRYARQASWDLPKSPSAGANGWSPLLRWAMAS